VDAFGSEEASDRLMRVMEDVAAKMLVVVDIGTQAMATPRDTITEGELRNLGMEHSVPSFQLEDLLMHSLLQPAGRDAVSRERLIRFAHRSFQDWFLARCFARKGGTFDFKLPPTASRFWFAMRADLEAGEALP
jgi:hypothetical protein